MHTRTLSAAPIVYLVWMTAPKIMRGRQATTTSDIFQPLMNAMTSPPISVTKFCRQQAAGGATAAAAKAG